MTLKLERNEVPALVGKLNSLMPSSYHINSTFFTTLAQRDPNLLDLLKPSPFQRPDFPLGEGLRGLQRELPVSPLYETILYKRKMLSHVF